MLTVRVAGTFAARSVVSPVTSASACVWAEGARYDDPTAEQCAQTH